MCSWFKSRQGSEQATGIVPWGDPQAPSGGAILQLALPPVGGVMSDTILSLARLYETADHELNTDEVTAVLIEEGRVDGAFYVMPIVIPSGPEPEGAR